MRIKVYCLLVIGLIISQYSLSAQSFRANGAVTLDAKITIGNQNVFFKTGVSLYGNLNLENIATEAGVSMYTGYLFKKHTIERKGWTKGYDVFYLFGYGRNDNLLGSSLSQYNASIVYEEKDNNEFYGIGFGFEKEFLPGSLQEFNQRIGRMMMRFSSNHRSFGLSFKNDLRIGGLFLGDATDFGATGSLYLTYVHAQNLERIHQFGFVIELFTPQQDYNRIADNSKNSDDGRKNVWHTTGVHKDVFYANSYVSYKLQQDHLIYQFSTGIESNKLGAYIQNTLHDGFGLNPRFPWNVTQKNKWYWQGELGTFINSL